MGVTLPQIRRLLDIRYNSRPKALERAFGALGHTQSGE